jgi:hypothetical protein
MAIDLAVEQPLSFNQAAKFLPDGRRPNHSTWWRWSRRGVKGVRLETVVFGAKRFTTAEAVLRFVAETTAAANGELPPPRTIQQRQRDIDRADRDLKAVGI